MGMLVCMLLVLSTFLPERGLGASKGWNEIRDLTHILISNKTNYFPSYKDHKFKLEVLNAGKVDDIEWLADNYIKTAEHMGTHVDAPRHFIQDGDTVDKFSLSQMHGPLAIIDIREKANANKFATVDVEDIKVWENKYGQIPPKSWVVMYSGWSKYWGKQLEYIGSLDNYHEIKFPGFSNDAIQYLLDNTPDLLGLGVDVVDCDQNGTDDNHVLLLGAGKLCIENLPDMADIPQQGAELFLLPMKIGDGTGAPSRVIAFWNSDPPACGATYITAPTMILILAFLLHQTVKVLIA